MWFEVKGEAKSIEDIPQALWWGMVTITTVGSGDESPTTPGGRIVAALLMVLGIGLFVAMPSRVAAYLTSDRDVKLNEVLEKLDNTTSRDDKLDEILKRLDALEEYLAKRDGGAAKTKASRDDTSS